jgi:hypothetical protein
MIPVHHRYIAMVRPGRRGGRGALPGRPASVEEEHMSFVTTQPEMLAWATENLQGVHPGGPTAIFNATQYRVSMNHRGR